MVKIITRAAVLLGIIALALAGCGSSSSTSTKASSSSGSSSSEAAAGNAPVSLPGTVNEGETGDATSGSLKVELDDFYFGPAYIKATPGETITLHLENEGKSVHTFTSDALGVDQQLSPGQDADVTVTMPMTGATQFHCRFHEAMGMQGAFFFNPGDAVGGAGSQPASASSSAADTGGYGYN